MRAHCCLHHPGHAAQRAQSTQLLLPLLWPQPVRQSVLWTVPTLSSSALLCTLALCPQLHLAAGSSSSELEVSHLLGWRPAGARRPPHPTLDRRGLLGTCSPHLFPQRPSTHPALTQETRPLSSHCTSLARSQTLSPARPSFMARQHCSLGVSRLFGPCPILLVGEDPMGHVRPRDGNVAKVTDSKCDNESVAWWSLPQAQPGGCASPTGESTARSHPVP